MVGLIGGETTVMFLNLPSALSQANGGKLRGIAVLSRKRSPSAPDFPEHFRVGDYLTLRSRVPLAFLLLEAPHAKPSWCWRTPSKPSPPTQRW